MFNSASKNLGANEKHFKEVQLFSASNLILEDNTFGDITFESFHGLNIIKIGSNTFKKTSDKIDVFFCWTCSIQHQPPKYDLQTILNQMTQLEYLSIGVNVNEIPSNAVGNLKKLQFISLFNGKQNLTIKSSAFHSLDHLIRIQIWETTINRIEKEAFKSATISDIGFNNCTLTGESFEKGAFDGIEKSFKIQFMQTNVSYLAESVFKPVLNNSLNSINFFNHKISNGKYNSKIDCDDCRNYWLIKENKQNQVKEAHCKDNDKLTLFDQEIKTKFSQKCK